MCVVLITVVQTHNSNKAPRQWITKWIGSWKPSLIFCLHLCYFLPFRDKMGEFGQILSPHNHKCK